MAAATVARRVWGVRLKSEKTARLRLLSNCNMLPSRDGNGADFHHGLLAS